ncbi:hypothetical protein ES695_15630 [Candidatus Atribacteria bacterium 1244-E10-H5-B2]|nr:MAG: hypothetical protein ES695_15630 [Candidatus Atribacteria bacterium 1244-E10-H5-B2]
MIPKKSTPIKNEILIDIFAKGMLNKEEMRIIFYIIRWSWGFDGLGRRQDWTKKLTKRKIADSIGMQESHSNENINRMIAENKIIVKDGCYQFNEHYESWKNLPKREVSNDKKLTEKGSKTYRKGKVGLPKREGGLTEKGSLGMPNNQGEGIKNKDVRGGEHMSKETNTKETNTKEKKKTLSKASFDKEAVVYQLTIYLEGKIRENNKSVQKRDESQLQSWCKDIDKLLRLDNANPDEVKQIIDWVVEDKFWAKNILCPASLRKQYPRFYKEVIDRGKSLEEKIATDHRLDGVD